jgi:flagellar basal body-associated protein FliL
LGEYKVANEHNIKTFTAADIEQYHKGLLSAKERHALEKAALDDPFLADALEGYAAAGVNAETDIAELKKRLEARIDERKVIPINTERRSSFTWLRIAAVIVLIAGAGLLVYQFAFNKSKNIAQLDSTKKEEIKAADSGKTSLPESKTKDSNVTSTANDLKQKAHGVTINDKTVPVRASRQTTGAGAIRKDSAANDYLLNTKPSAAFKKPSVDDKTAQTNNGDIKDEKKELAKEQVKTLTVKAKQDANATPQQSEGLFYKESVVTDRKANNQYRNTNIFRGRITDANNNPVPFANVTNPADNVGTYSDVKGYFNLTSPDSVLKVQIRSIGFENNNVQLRNNVSNNQVVMQDDHSRLSEVVISNKKPNAAARSRESNMKVEEPEPADGWDNYDTYLVNNLNIPDEMKTKQTRGDVEVSFEVDKNGAPINIKVEKSLCGKCDEEAIRLIKDGPKWKRKDRKSRTRVTVPF